MNPSTMTLKFLIVAFTKSISSFVTMGKWLKLAANIHLPHMVWLFQSVGFNINRIDSSPPEVITPLENGNRIIITCGHSGQRSVLELEEKPGKDRYLNRSGNPQDKLWEITGKDNGIVDIGSDVLPPTSEDLNDFVISGMNFLLKLMQDFSKEDNLNEFSNDSSNENTSVPSSPKEIPKIFNRSLHSIIKMMILENVGPLQTQSTPNNPLAVMHENASLTEDTETELIKLLEMTLSLLKSTNRKF